MRRVPGTAVVGTLALFKQVPMRALVTSWPTANQAVGRAPASLRRKHTTHAHRHLPRAGNLTLSTAASPSSSDEGSEEGPAAAAHHEHEHSVRELRQLLDAAGGSAIVLTGAGMSTDSGIPDYRGPRGSYSRGHKPMTHDEFLSSESNRKRYWARSTFGWDSFSRSRPNAAHKALAELEAVGKIRGVITQNVDGLHQKAGSRNVVDLHGRNDKLECMTCGVESSRNAFQADLARLNAPWISKYARELAEADKDNSDPSLSTAASGNGHEGGGARLLRADGDADVEPGEHLHDFVVPPCVRCGGVLKPTVLFFGDNIPRQRVEETYRIVDEASMLIAAGSSLQVYSAFRLVKRVADAGKKIAVVNLGGTRAERSGLDLLKVEAGVSSVLPKLL